MNLYKALEINDVACLEKIKPEDANKNKVTGKKKFMKTSPKSSREQVVRSDDPRFFD